MGLLDGDVNGNVSRNVILGRGVSRGGQRGTALPSGGWPGGTAVLPAGALCFEADGHQPRCIWFRVGEEQELWVELSEDWTTTW